MYKSIHTGSQIDAAVTAVMENQAEWSKKEVAVTATLSASGWKNKKQTAAVNGIAGDASTQIIEVAPTSSCIDAASKARIKPVSQTAGHITFECSDVPSSDIEFVTIIKTAN